MSTLKIRALSLLLTLVMIASSLCFLAVNSYGNDLNQPVEYRDEEGEIIGEEQGGLVPYAGEYVFMPEEGYVVSTEGFIKYDVVTDGEKEEFYDDGLKGKISLLYGDTAEGNEVSGDVWFLCDERYLYVFVEAHDDERFDVADYITICAECGKQRGRHTGCEHVEDVDYDARTGEETVDIWMDDCVELYIDWKNDGSEAEQYRVSRSGKASSGYDTFDLGFEAKSKSDINGWCAEFAIPLPYSASEAGVSVVLHSQNSLTPYSETYAVLNNFNASGEDPKDPIYYDFIVFPDRVEDFNRLPFTDVKKSDWYYFYVKQAIEEGLFNGISPTLFAPNMPMTRAMFATVLYRMAGSPEVTGEMPFTDVKEGAYYYDAVLWAYQNEVVNGMTPDIFAHDDVLTREQLVTVLYRYTANSGYDTSKTADLAVFRDVDEISEYAAEAMSWSVSADIIEGTNVNGIDCLDPQGKATRAQVATILWRYSAYLTRLTRQ